jgi:DNA-binding NarL/FixJ family response regulator
MNTCTLTQAEAIPETIIRTLVADDSPFMLKVLARAVESAGNFELIGSATDGCQALRYVSLLSPELVLIDVHMPRINGIQALRCIKQRENAPVVIVVTSDDSSATKRMAEEAGADGFVIKDRDLGPRLLHALRDVSDHFAVQGERQQLKR